MTTGATIIARIVLRPVIVGGVIEMLAIKEIDDCTTGRNKHHYGQE